MVGHGVAHRTRALVLQGASAAVHGTIAARGHEAVLGHTLACAERRDAVIRIDSCLVPPGWITAAKMHSLLYRGGKLYIIVTGDGPASQVDYTQRLREQRQARDMVVNAAETLVVNRYLRQIKATEAQISWDNLDAWATRPGNRCFAAAEVQGFCAEDRETVVELRFKAGGKKFAFDCSILDVAAIWQLAACMYAELALARLRAPG